MKIQQTALWGLAALAIGVVLAETQSAEAGIFRRNRAAAAARTSTNNSGVVANNGTPSSGSTAGQGGWNASNTWYNHPNNGNYAPPPYATSKKAFYQVGPVPAIGGVRSLPGWGGAR